MAEPPPLLVAEGLARSFGGVKAVRAVSLSLQAGEVLALIGPNGAGKSTCFNLLNGQLRPDSGRVALRGRDVTGLPPRRMARAGVARTFQVATTFASMTVRENVATAGLARQGGAWRGSGDLRAALGEADRWLEAAGLETQAERPAAELAYGDLKRLDFAVALAGEPVLLLMDEPTAGMAPGERHALMRAATAAARTRRMGLLFTEHDMDVVFAYADRIMVLSRGEVIAVGAPEAVRADPLVRATYLGEGFASAPALP